MRTSRISKDTAKLFDNVPLSPPRRTTRSSLARFAYTDATKTAPPPPPQHPDIEDSISPPAKRRRKALEPPANNTVKPEPVGAVKTEPTDTVKPEPIDDEDDRDVLATIASPPPKTAPRRARKPARKTADPDTGKVIVSPPSDWEDMYNAVRRMRAPGGAAYGAAVDTMGCERLADRTASPKDQRFHTLISLMLSSQTKDTVNAVVMKRLQTELPAYKEGAPMGLNLDNVLAVEPNMLNEFIWAVGFHNNKTKYIKQTAEILRDTWNGDIPDSIQGLTSLPGVGPKMAYLCLSVAWNRTEGIGVDVHVHRITNLWGWNKTKNPEETRHALQSWLPQDRWREINSLLVGLGQSVCLPVGHKCGDCELGMLGLCKAADKKKVSEGRRIKKEQIKMQDDDGDDSPIKFKEEHVKKEEEKDSYSLVIKEEHVKTEEDNDSYSPAIKEETEEVDVEVNNKVELTVKEEHVSVSVNETKQAETDDAKPPIAALASVPVRSGRQQRTRTAHAIRAT